MADYFPITAHAIVFYSWLSLVLSETLKYMHPSLSKNDSFELNLLNTGEWQVMQSTQDTRD